MWVKRGFRSTVIFFLLNRYLQPSPRSFIYCEVNDQSEDRKQKPLNRFLVAKRNLEFREASAVFMTPLFWPASGKFFPRNGPSCEGIMCMCRSYLGEAKTTPFDIIIPHLTFWCPLELVSDKISTIMIQENITPKKDPLFLTEIMRQMTPISSKELRSSSLNALV